jgi:hypothetical protein
MRLQRSGAQVYPGTPTMISNDFSDSDCWATPQRALLGTVRRVTQISEYRPRPLILLRGRWSVELQFDRMSISLQVCAGAVTSFAGPMVNGRGFVADLTANTVLGGLAAVAGGGKFVNGAVTGAFGYLFNAEAISAHHWFDQSITERYWNRGLLTEEAYAELMRGPFATTRVIQDISDPDNRVHLYDRYGRAAQADNIKLGEEFIRRNAITAENPMTANQARALLYEVRTSTLPALSEYRQRIFDWINGRTANTRHFWQNMRPPYR